jgi:hypothetical protein
MNGTKYSYSTDAVDRMGDSTVVALKDGSLLEVRRGAQTRWNTGETRQRWARLEEWMAMLPAEATIKKSGCGASAGGSPEMARILGALTAAGVRSASTLGYTRARGERIAALQRLKMHIEKQIPAAPATADEQYRAQRRRNRIHCIEMMIKYVEQRVPEESKPLILNSGRLCCHLLALNTAGQLQRLYFNGRRGIFGVRKNGKIQVAATLTELGFPVEPELWLTNPREEATRRLAA